MKYFFVFAFILGTLVLLGRSQSSCSNTKMCHEDCKTDSTQDECCILELPPDPSASVYPLGYQLFFLPGVDSPDPAPCVRVNFPPSSYAIDTNINYLVFAAETAGTNLCIRKANSLGNPTCGTTAIFFCMMASVSAQNPYMDVDIFCLDSCEAVDSSFYMKAVISTLDKEDEYFCDNNSTIILPSSLIMAPTDIVNPPPVSMESSASIPSSLHVLTSLILSAILVKRGLL